METLASEEVERLQHTLEAIGRDLTQKLQSAAIAMGRALEPDMSRWRVMMMLPALDMRAVMVHGLVPYTREEA